MDEKEIISTVLNDRNMSLEGVKTSWVKKQGIDLLAKYWIMLINSFGKGNLNKECNIFVDEIKNNNMINNLAATKREFIKHGATVKSICFYQFVSKNHVKVGITKSIILIVRCFFKSILVFVSAIFKKNSLKFTSKILINEFEEYTKLLNAEDKLFFIMSDHHFFSSIIAINFTNKSHVIQHGLVMGKSFYYPIRAGYFYAWGKHSKELLNNDPKVLVTGTYKFNEIVENKKNSEYDYNDLKNVVFCIGSLDHDSVKRKIDILLSIFDKTNIQLIIKDHPGSLFDSSQWQQLYKNKRIIFYKEELLQNIDFDLAITENSTVIMDLIAMHKPFILFDELGYFDVYKDIIPNAQSENQLRNIISNLKNYNFASISDRLIKEELNDGECSIYERTIE